jgi:hypothetical protein
MKILELNTLPTPVLLVWGLPEDAENIAIDESYPDRVCFDINIDTITHPDYRLLPDGNWQLIGKLSELTEEKAKGLVDYGSYLGTYKNYKTNDNHKSNQLGSSLESFHSAIEAQSKTLPENTLIFKKS